MGPQRTARTCYVCGTGDNPVIAEEAVEHRFGVPLLPEPEYRFARCRRCATLYVDSAVDDAWLERVYREEAPEQAAELWQGDHVEANRLPEFRRNWRLLRRWRAPRPGDRLLDLGCQTGEFGALALADGVVPDGIELSLPYAQASRARWGPGSTVHAGRAETAPFAPGAYAYVTSFETLEHMLDPLAALRRMVEWLAGDGVLAVSVPSSDYFHLKYRLLTGSPLAGPLRRALARRQAWYARQVLPHTHIYNFSPGSLRRLLHGAGLQPVHVGLTSYNGRLAPLLNAAARAGYAGSFGRLAVAPGVIAVAVLPRSRGGRHPAARAGL